MSSTGYTRGSAQNSNVIDETMNVIDEHITSMHKPSLGVLGGNDRRPSNDSGSQYSTHFSRRPSSVHGGEEAEEDNSMLTRERVMRWSPIEVAQYLEKAGVEKSHCEVFQEEEFSGEVLLGLDQSAILLQELRLGSIGRRMKTWAKIRALQEEVRNAPSMQKRVPDQPSASYLASPSNRQSARAISPHMITSPPPADSSISTLRSPTQTEFRQPSPQMGFSNQPFPPITHRPSAAEIRSLAHSRQSSTDFIPGMATRVPSVAEQSVHNKQASLDTSWTMNNKGMSQERTWPTGPRQTSPIRMSRPASTAHVHSISTDRHAFERPVSMMTDGDRGYSSGGEGETKRQKGFLKKTESADQSSTTLGRKRSSTLFWRGSRPPSPEKRPQSTSNVRTISEPLRDSSSPTVTRLAYDSETPRGDRISGTQTPVSENPPLENQTMSDLRKGLRTISGAISGRDKGVVHVPVERTLQGDSSLPDTPTLAGSSTPSINSKSIDLEDANKSEFSTPTLPQNATAARKKPKKATSAYIRGLEKKSPQEQMIGCDFSGWMKKKSSNLMTMWKPRLFVLRGRRLSYYYSENDKEEKGLIDISNHRVLPADNDFITGLHATLTGVTSSSSTSMSSPGSYFNSKHSSSPMGSAAESPMSTTGGRTTVVSASKPMKGDNQPFIFKLVPPRTGLSKAVNFTKPTVHYFAVPTLSEGRLWMAALMKATIDKDETKQVVTTYQQKTISLEKARARRERPPGLKEVDEKDEDEDEGDDEGLENGDEERAETLGGTQENEADGYSMVESTREGIDVDSPASSEAEILRSQERERQLAQHQANASQSMSFVSSLKTAALDTGNSTPSADTSGSLRKWSFSSSTKASVGRVGSQGQGLGIQGTAPAPGPAVRDVGAW